MIINFTIEGEPKAKARPKVTKQGFAYTPKDTVNYESWVKQCYLDRYAGFFLEGEIKASIIAYFSIPKSKSKKIKEKMINGDINPTKKPDVDNIAKIILDSLNGIAYHDDSEIVQCSIKKRYAELPRVEVYLESEGIRQNEN